MPPELEKRRKAIEKELLKKGTPNKKAKSSAYAIATASLKKKKK